MREPEELKRWTAKRKSALVLEIIQGKTTVAEVSRSHDLTPSEVQGWVDEGKRGMENALRAKPEDVREQYERQLRDLQQALILPPETGHELFAMYRPMAPELSWRFHFQSRMWMHLVEVSERIGQLMQHSRGIAQVMQLR